MSSYGSSYSPAKGANNPRPSTGYSAASSNYPQSGHSSRSQSGRSQTVVVHNRGGTTKDSPNSSSAPNSGYWK